MHACMKNVIILKYIYLYLGVIGYSYYFINLFTAEILLLGQTLELIMDSVKQQTAFITV